MSFPFISEPFVPGTTDLPDRSPQSTGHLSSTTGDSDVAVNSPSPGSSVGVAVGGAVGGVIVGLLVCVAVIALCVVLVIGKHRSKGKHQSEGVHDRDAAAMENVGYGGGKTSLMG